MEGSLMNVSIDSFGKEFLEILTLIFIPRNSEKCISGFHLKFFEARNMSVAPSKKY